MKCTTLFFLSALGCAPAFAADVTLEDLVRSTKVALLTVENGWPASPLTFDHAELTVGARVAMEGRGKLSFFVVTVGGSTEQAASSTVVLTLRPPDREAGSDVSEDRFADALAAAILGAANAVREAGRGQPPLEATQLEATIGFALVEDGEGGVSLMFAPVSLELGGGASGARSHSIKAVFRKVEDD